MSISTNFLNKYKISAYETHKVFRTLCYFKLFEYPLTAKEIFERSNAHSLESVEEALSLLVKRSVATVYENTYYLLGENEESLVKRLKGNELAQGYLKKAQYITKFISQFPFVRAVMISGSLSKNYIDAQSDIDYFIITASNRLWIARFFFVLTQKLFFLNKTKYLCFNYMLDETRLDLADKSIFTALEAVTAIPVYGGEQYLKFLEQNQWTRNFFPNYPIYHPHLVTTPQTWLKRGLEWALSGSIGEWIDTRLMKITAKRWQERYGTASFKETGLWLDRHVAKAHTGNNFDKIMTKFEVLIHANY